MNPIRAEMEKGTVKGLIAGESMLVALGVATAGIGCLLAGSVHFVCEVYDVCRKNRLNKTEPTDSE